MTAQRLLLLDVDGVLVEPGESRRLPGTAETLAQLRAGGDAVLSLLTRADEAAARQRIVSTGLDRYLDFAVGAYGDTASVAAARQRARESYGADLAVVVVTADPALLAEARAGADTVIAVARPDRNSPADADHVVAGIAEIEPLVSHVHAG